MEGNGTGGEGMLPGMLGLEVPHHQQQQSHSQTYNQCPPHLRQQMVAFASHDSDHHDQSVKPISYNYTVKGKQPQPIQSQQQLALSDEDEQGFGGDDNGGNGVDVRKKVSNWQRVKWTDNMVRILIMVVYYVGDDNVPEALASHPGDSSTANKKKTGGGLLQKKGKWKSVSMAMMEKGFYVSPQQCEDKFNDLNKRYKRVNDIIGRGTACKVVENQNLLETLDHLSPKMKDEVRKLLNSKHLFFREMCAYHNNGGITVNHAVPHQSLELAVVSPSGNSQQQRCFHSSEGGVNSSSRGDMEGLNVGKRGEDDDGEEDDDDYDDADEEESHSKGRHNRNRHNDHTDNEEDNKIWLKKRKIRGNGSGIIISPSMQQLNSELMSVLQDGTKSPWEQRQWIKNRMLQLEEQRVSYQCEAFGLEKERLKWVKYCAKKERDLELMKLANERKKLQNDRMVLLLRQRELEFGDLHQQQQHPLSRRTDPSCLS